MIVKLHRATLIAPDGIHGAMYPAGEHDFPDDCAETLIRGGLAYVPEPRIAPALMQEAAVPTAEVLYPPNKRKK